MRVIIESDGEFQLRVELYDKRQGFGVEAGKNTPTME
jgi:hypothetical protein